MLLDDGVIDTTGALDTNRVDEEVRAAYGDRLTDRGRVILSDPTDDGEVFLTQEDIRQVQLAKGAIQAGIRTILREAGITADQVRRVHLAGGFGALIRPESAARIGLLAGIDPARVSSIGNAAGAGAGRALVDRQSLDETDRISRECEYLELSGSTVFQEYFAEAMLFPGNGPTV